MSVCITTTGSFVHGGLGHGEAIKQCAETARRTVSHLAATTILRCDIETCHYSLETSGRSAGRSRQRAPTHGPMQPNRAALEARSCTHWLLGTATWWGPAASQGVRGSGEVAIR